MRRYFRKKFGKTSSTKQTASLRSNVESSINQDPSLFLSNVCHISSELPENYSELYIRAIPRDPHWLYVYWQILAEKIKKEKSNSNFAASQNTLRLLKINKTKKESEPEKISEIKIGPGTNNWYFNISEPENLYIVEYGLKNKEGRFKPLTSTSPIQVPLTKLAEPYSADNNKEIMSITELSIDNLGIEIRNDSGKLLELDPSKSTQSSSSIFPQASLRNEQ
ncbi:DUF4912 domain-containing protein [Cellulosispirillum alkaliphilum]|uniref:DUF4912 domain-containing protein n=1 Tax=Cellulosispirillum alkaliphilum TaxID=3039283 RepID=UPI003D6FF86C